MKICSNYNAKNCIIITGVLLLFISALFNSCKALIWENENGEEIIIPKFADVEIEHVVPRSILFDDNNFVLMDFYKWKEALNENLKKRFANKNDSMYLTF